MKEIMGDGGKSDEKQDRELEETISLCPHCFCMTHTIEGKCGKCGATKMKWNMSGEVKE